MRNYLIFIYALTLLFNACTGPGGSKKPDAPVMLAILDDHSKSATVNKVPKLTEEMVKSLIGVVAETGGSISYLPLTKQSFVPVVRLDLQPVSGKRLKEKARIHHAQQSAIQAFEAEVFKSIAAKRRATRTDFWGAVKRVNRLFNEITIGVAPKKILLVLSDAEDDAGRVKPFNLPDDIIVVCVGNTDEKAVKTLSKNVIVFEGLAAALTYINHIAKGGQA